MNTLLNILFSSLRAGTAIAFIATVITGIIVALWCVIYIANIAFNFILNI